MVVIGNACHGPAHDSEIRVPECRHHGIVRGVGVRQIHGGRQVDSENIFRDGRKPGRLRADGHLSVWRGRRRGAWRTTTAGQFERRKQGKPAKVVGDGWRKAIHSIRWAI